MSKPIWIEAELVLAIHDRQLIEHGGAAGLRDEALLHSALGRPKNLAYESADVVELAVKYTAGIVQNRPFVDGIGSQPSSHPGARSLKSWRQELAGDSV
jgi:death on curing protein